MPETKPIMIAEVQVRKRTFKYVMGGVSLEFTLRTDVKQELKYFTEMLERAVVDVKEELNNIDEK